MDSSRGREQKLAGALEAAHARVRAPYLLQQCHVLRESPLNDHALDLYLSFSVLL